MEGLVWCMTSEAVHMHIRQSACRIGRKASSGDPHCHRHLPLVNSPPFRHLPAPEPLLPLGGAAALGSPGAAPRHKQQRSHASLETRSALRQLGAVARPIGLSPVIGGLLTW